MTSPTPEVLNRTAELLATAASCLDPPRGHSPHMLREAISLRASISRARLLLDSAASYHTGWIQQISATAAGYTAGGQPSPINHSARLQLHA
jgi:hypothetical protein